MATVPEYAAMLRQAGRAVGAKMGVQLSAIGVETRVALRVVIGIIAALVKLLVDKGVITDEEIQTALGSSVAQEYPAEPVVPPDPPQLPSDPPAEPTP
jgi:hypothetical protein